MRLTSMVRSLLLAAAGNLAASAADFYNGGVYSVDRPIDAVSFVNAGTFTASIGDIFATRNTESFTNLGTITASLGMELQRVDAKGFRFPSQSIVNGDRAVIEGVGLSIQTVGYPEGQAYTYGDGGYLTLNADSIVNRGRMSVSFWGDLSAKGRQVDLSRSTLTTLNRRFAENGRIASLEGNITVANFPGGIENLYWGYWTTEVNFGSFATRRQVTTAYPTATNPVLVTNILANVDISYLAAIDRAPGDPVANPRNWIPDAIATAGAPPVPAIAYIQTNQLTATNNLINAVFIINRNSNVLATASVDGNRPLSVTLAYLNTNNTAGSVDLESLQILESFTTAPTNIYAWDYRAPASAAPYNVRVTRNVGVNIPITRADRARIGNELDPLNPLSRSNLLAKYLNDARSGANTAFIKDLFTTGYYSILTNGVTYTNTVSTNDYMAYSFAITSLPSKIPNPTNSSYGSIIRATGGRVTGAQSQSPFGYATNLAGRIRVQADNLKLDDARIRAHGVVNLQAKHVSSTANTSIAAPYAHYDLGSTNGTLEYRGLNPVGQPNLTGVIKVFVTAWTNTAEFPDPAAAAAAPADPNAAAGGAGATPSNLLADTHFRVMIIDADIDPFKYTGELVGLKLRAANLVTADPVLYQIPEVDAPPSSFPDGFAGASAVAGNEQVAPITENWSNQAPFQLIGSLGVSHRTFPKLKTLANASDILGEQVALGVGQNQPLAWLTNSGSINSSGYLGLGASVIHHSRRLAATNVLDLSADELVLRGTNLISAGGRLTIKAKNLDASEGGAIRTRNLLYLDVADRFTTTNVPGKLLVLQASGVSLAGNAAVSDLSGLSVGVSAGRFESASVEWPGLDLGPAADGYINNSAIAALVLSVGEFGRVDFRPSGNGPRAIYTDRLELGGDFVQYFNITNKTLVDPAGLASALNFDGSIRVYFKTAVVNGTLLPGALLDQFLDGRLQMIQTVNPASGPISVEVSNGYVVEAPWAVRYSVTLDSDGDGIVNAIDATPFSGAVVNTQAVELQGRPYLEISWDAAGNTEYQILAQEPAVGSEWIRLSQLSNPSASPKVLKFYDALDQGSGAKTYRIVYKP